MKRKLFFLISLVAVVALVSVIGFTYANAATNNNVKPSQKLKKIAQKKNLGEVVKTSAAKAKKIKVKNDKLKKWITRTEWYYSMRGESKTKNKVLEKAKETMKKRKVWFEFAKKHYGIDIKQKELNNYIQKKMNLGNPKAKEVAKGLGLSLHDYYFKFERDNFKQNLAWEKLRPILTKEFPPTKYEQKNPLVYHNDLVKKFNTALGNYKKTHNIKIAG